METKIYVCGDLVQILVQIYGYIIKTSDKHTCSNVFERNEFVLSEQEVLPGVIIDINAFGVYKSPYGRLSITEVFTEEVDFTLGNNIVFVDHKKLQFPLQLTTWQEGDTFKPFGMKGKKKLSDFLIDEKVELLDKLKVLTLKQQNKIVCVVGYRLDNDFRLTGNETVVLKIEWIKNV